MNERDKELAKQALTENDWDTYVHITKFANLIRADERESCAKVCEEVELHFNDRLKHSDPRKTCAAGIRARGNT